MPEMRDLLRRYVIPFSVVPASPGNLKKVAQSLKSCYQPQQTDVAYPSAVGIDVSDACNIACTVCSREIAWDKRHHAFLKLPDFIHIYDQIKPVYLSLSGYGETLLNKEIAAMVRHATLAGSRVNIVSNGTLLNAERAQALLDAGLAKLKISIDGADPEVYAKHRVGADLEVVFQNIERLVTMRDARHLIAPHIELQFVLFRENIDQLSKLIRLCHQRFQGIEPNILVMFTYGQQAGFVERALPDGDVEALAELHRARLLAQNYGFRRCVGSIDAAIKQLSEDLSSAPCYVPWYSCLISTDGEVYPCCYHSIRGTSVGNVRQTPFVEIWNGARMQTFRRQLQQKRCADKVCASCRYEDTPMERVFSTIAKLPGLSRSGPE